MSIEYETNSFDSDANVFDSDANAFDSEKINSFNSLLLELNDCIKMFKNRTLVMNNYNHDRTYDWSEPLNILWGKTSDKGKEIEAFLLDYKKSNTNNVIYKNMIKKINIAYKEFETCIASIDDTNDEE